MSCTVMAKYHDLQRLTDELFCSFPEHSYYTPAGHVLEKVLF